MQTHHTAVCPERESRHNGRTERYPQLIPLDDRILSENLEPIPFKHPVANNKYEALS